jgi:hypothetical protein
MKPYVPVAGYLLAITATVIVWNANIGAAGWWAGVVGWGCASILFGAVTGRLIFFLWAFVAIPIAVPFGVPDNYQWSEPLPIWWFTAVISLFAAGLIFVAALARRVFDGKLRTLRP